MIYISSNCPFISLHQCTAAYPTALLAMAIKTCHRSGRVSPYRDTVTQDHPVPWQTIQPDSRNKRGEDRGTQSRSQGLTGGSIVCSDENLALHTRQPASSISTALAGPRPPHQALAREDPIWQLRALGKLLASLLPRVDCTCISHHGFLKLSECAGSSLLPCPIRTRRILVINPVRPVAFCTLSQICGLHPRLQTEGCNNPFKVA